MSWPVDNAVRLSVVFKDFALAPQDVVAGSLRFRVYRGDGETLLSDLSLDDADPAVRLGTGSYVHYFVPNAVGSFVYEWAGELLIAGHVLPSRAAAAFTVVEV